MTNADTEITDELASSDSVDLNTPFVEPDVVSPALSEEGAAADDDEASAEDVGKSAALMSGLVIVSRITGFFRTWAQAFGMGTTITASAFTIANNLPNALYELVMGGMLVTAFLPVYVSTKKKAGREGASAYASNLLSLVTLLMGVLALLSFIFAGQIIWTQAFNASSEFDFDLATFFFRFFAIEIVLYALSSVISSVLNAERDYLWSTAAPIANNIVITAAFFIYGVLVETQPFAAIMVLAISNPLGVLVQVVMQIPALRRHGVKLSPRIDIHHPLIRETTLSIGIPTLIVTFVSFATTSVQTLLLAFSESERRLHHVLRAHLVHPAVFGFCHSHYDCYVYRAFVVCGKRQDRQIHRWHRQWLWADSFPAHSVCHVPHRLLSVLVQHAQERAHVERRCPDAFDLHRLALAFAAVLRRVHLSAEGVLFASQDVAVRYCRMRLPARFRSLSASCSLRSLASISSASARPSSLWQSMP